MHKEKGGALAHVARRFVHLCMILVPIFYFQFAEQVASWLSLSTAWLLISLLALTVIIEAIRLGFGVVVYLQREDERHRISAAAWTVVSLLLVLLLAPKQFVYPIVISCAIVDPLLGEMRVRQWPKEMAIIIGLVFVFAIWSTCSYWLHISWWLAWLMAPVTVAAEWPNLRWIDDNAMMLLVPLAVVMGVAAIFI